jgi:hypothetical protein
MTIDQTHAEVNHAWSSSYSPEAIAAAVNSIDNAGHRINMLLARLAFRGIYFPMMGKWEWMKVISQNRRTIFKIVREAIATRRKTLQVREVAAAAPDPELTV